MHAYAQTQVREQRDRLIVEHLPMAERIARRVARRRPPGLGDEDLVAAAYLGLTQAAERYDAGRSEPFVAFAEKRIRGAVYDELRRGDILPRRQRAKAKRVRAVMVRLQHRLGREPSDTEVAAELGVPLEHYLEELEGLVHVAVLDLPNEPTAANAMAPDRHDDPEQEVVQAQLVLHVTNGLRELEPRDAQLLSLYYLEALNYVEIGRVLGVGESRVCQLHARAIARLRARLLAEEVGS